jgi:hypothetical protein
MRVRQVPAMQRHAVAFARPQLRSAAAAATDVASTSAPSLGKQCSPIHDLAHSHNITTMSHGCFASCELVMEAVVPVWWGGVGA